MNGERGGPKATPTPVSPPSSTEAQHTSGLLASALDYAGRGWSVFPCEPGGKRPLGAAVPHGLHDASTSPTSVGRWWRRWPSANIGLVTGVIFDVVDVDTLDGLEALADLAAAAGDDSWTWRYGPAAETGGGGWHLLMAPTGAGNRAGLLPGVDYRGRAGYIVAAPSVHATGRPYRWIEEWSAGTDLRPAPTWLVELVAPSRPTVAPAALARPGGTALPTGDRKAAYGRRALESEALAVALAVEGTRNHTLNTAALKLGQVVAGGYLDAAEVVATLLAAAERAGLERREAETTIASGMAAGMAQPRRLAS